MLKYLFSQLSKCQEALRKELYSENKRGRLAFLNDRDLFLLITAGQNRSSFFSQRERERDLSLFHSGYDLRSLSDHFSLVIPSLHSLLFSEQLPDEVIGCLTTTHQENILFSNVRLSLSLLSIDFSLLSV